MASSALRLALVVGARPNFMKAAPLLKAFDRIPSLQVVLVHTGQHYDPALSDVFFDELEIRRPDVMLAVGSGSHGRQTGQIMSKFEDFLLEEKAAGRPLDWVVVVGDVNSTVACALVASKMGVKVAHVEAGLRSGDRSMPEEINRVVTDHICDLLLCSEPAGVANLAAEGIAGAKVAMPGNVMIDTLRRFLPKAMGRGTPGRLGLAAGAYGVVTLHRPSNVDAPQTLEALIDRLRQLSRRLPLVFSVHPRTADRISRLRSQATSDDRFLMLEPQGYLDFLCLTAQAKLIITDSGGLQEESTALGVPCLTLRANTERPITLDEGSSRLIGGDFDLLEHLVESILDGEYPSRPCPALWDGAAAERIAAIFGGISGASTGGQASTADASRRKAAQAV